MCSPEEVSPLNTEIWVYNKSKLHIEFLLTFVSKQFAMNQPVPLESKNLVHIFGGLVTQIT